VTHKDASRCMARDNEMQILWRSCGENERPPFIVFIDYRPSGWIPSFSLGLGGAGQGIGLPSVPVTIGLSISDSKFSKLGREPPIPSDLVGATGSNQ
jgi:hypothetical protein